MAKLLSDGSTLLNPLMTKILPKIPFLTVQSAFLAAITLTGPKFRSNLSFYQKIDFPKIRYKSVQYSTRCMRISQNLDLFCHYLFLIFFLAPFLSFFSALLFSLPCALHILSGCREKLGVNYGQSQPIIPAKGSCDT